MPPASRRAALRKVLSEKKYAKMQNLKYAVMQNLKYAEFPKMILTHAIKNLLFCENIPPAIRLRY